MNIETYAVRLAEEIVQPTSAVRVAVHNAADMLKTVDDALKDDLLLRWCLHGTCPSYVPCGSPLWHFIGANGLLIPEGRALAAAVALLDPEVTPTGHHRAFRELTRWLRLVHRTIASLRREEAAFTRAQGYYGHLEDGFHSGRWRSARRTHLTDIGLLHKGYPYGYGLNLLGTLVRKYTRTLRERRGLCDSAADLQRYRMQRHQEAGYGRS